MYEGEKCPGCNAVWVRIPDENLYSIRHQKDCPTYWAEKRARFS